MSIDFPLYTTDYISGVMSLRKPQTESLKILERVLKAVAPRKDVDMEAALSTVNKMFPICTDFERNFMSLTFALATGVGKTRLMGAFITYLYTQKGIRNFFVVAPNTTIYEKLRRDLSDIDSPKYVFRGLGCFSVPPQIVTDDDYKSRNISASVDDDIRIFVYNIDKFNKEDAKMRRVSEMIGDTFYRYLSDLDDLVLIMDESHHYRAERGAAALNELNPVLGLELTATPLVTKGSSQTPFRNVVYEYPLSKAIEDGYTRTPFAVTRTDIDFYNFGDEQLDRLMLKDGIICHENTKRKLEAYAVNNRKPLVKPFMLVVCKDTDHAAWVYDFVRSDDFRDGIYKDKTIVVHSKQRGSETEENMRLLLEVERADNPVEIVIHVNMLKEGWDVNNLYTIVPLRTAASKILREQMVGRGLRLPYGERTGDREVDAVMLTAHDKFAEILAEAQRGDSIFKAGNVIKAEEVEEEHVSGTQLAFEFEPHEARDEAYEYTKMQRTEKNDAAIDKAVELIEQKVQRAIQDDPEHDVTEKSAKIITDEVAGQMRGDRDWGEIFNENAQPLEAWLQNRTERTCVAAKAKYIPIPIIKITDAGVEEYEFADFDLDLSDFNHAPIANDILLQNLEDPGDRQRVRGDAIDFEGYNPKRVILDELRKKPEIDYQKCGELLRKLITQLCEHYESRYGENGTRNIVMMYRREIAEKMYGQMMRHFQHDSGIFEEEVVGTRNFNYKQEYKWKETANLNDDNFTHNISSVLFTGIKKGVFSTAKFDSREGELTLARVMENDPSVLNWLRPCPGEFNITYNHGRRYEPDFVVETKDIIYLTEVKGVNLINDPDTIAKKERGIQYCKAASRWGRANGYKEWQYLFIPATQVQANSSFPQIALRFREL